MPERALEFARVFPAEIGAAVRDAIDAGAAVVMMDRPETREFLRHPVVALELVNAELNQLRSTRQQLARIVWCYRGDASYGLDGSELSAVLGRSMYLSTVAVVRDDDEKRVLAVGSMREERLGVAIVLDERIEHHEALALVESIGDAPRAPIIVLVSAGWLRSVSPSSALARALLSHNRSGGGLGLWIPQTARGAALADPQSQVAPFGAIGLPVPLLVRFEGGETLDACALDGFMRGAAIRLDLSVPIDSGAAPTGAISRAGAYTGGSPYRPQPFDLRVPWFRCDDSMWAELPAHELSKGATAAWWAERTGPSDEELAQLLDSDRREAFDRQVRVDTGVERSYADFRIYNWPVPQPPVRASLLLAPATSASDAIRMLDDVAAFAEKTPAVRVVDATTLHETAVAEVIARFDTTAERAIRLQGDAHRYLRHIPYDAPLRQDYGAFARFIPASLGRTLEIGSGYGVLAWTLAPRASQYVCLDLEPEMFGAIRHDLNQHAVLADMQHLPLADGSVDTVVANNVIEHLYDPLAGLKEVRRVLRDEGRIFALVPLDALNSRHELPAHHWKINADAITPAFAEAGLEVARVEVLDLYALGVRGAFPSCQGLAAMVEARRSPAPQGAQATPHHPTVRKQNELAGRLLPAIRERVRFEQLSNRRVVAIDPERSDEEEFEHYGAHVMRAGGLPWAAEDGSVDVVYGFLTVRSSSAAAVLAEAQRVLAPGGRVVIAFRNRDSLQYLAKVRSHYGGAFDLASLGLDTLARTVAGANEDADFVTHAWLTELGGGFSRSTVACTNLSVDDLPDWSGPEYPAEFWRWLSGTAGRFLIFCADR